MERGLFWCMSIYLVIGGFQLASSSLGLIEDQQELYLMELREHFLCKYVDTNETPSMITSTFTIDDQIFSYLTFTNSSEGDEIRWLFKGPHSLSYETKYLLHPDDNHSYAELDIDEVDPEQTVGDWNITVYFNGNTVSIKTFTIKEPLTGLLWWGPFVGLFIILSVIIITVFLVLRQNKI